MRKFQIYIILTGILLVLSSCVPVVNTLYKVVFRAPPISFDLGLESANHIDLRVDENTEVEFSISLEFADHNWEDNAIRYSYNIKNDDYELQEWVGIIDGDSLDTRSSRSKSSTVLVEKRFPILDLSPEQRDLSITIELEYLSKDQAPVLSAQALVYRDPPRFRVSFISTAVIWTFGILLVLIGTIQWIQRVAVVSIPKDAMEPGESERLWTMLCHLGALLGYVFPFGHIIAPLALWMLKRNHVAGVDKAGRESLNFQLTITLFALVAIMLSIVFIGFVLLFLIIAFHFSMTLYASLRAQRGLDFSYPMTIRIIKQ